MAAVFIKLLNMSIAASWLILAVVLFRVFLKNAPKWIRCILWGLVAVRLICPFSIESIFSLLPSVETIPQDIMYMERPTIHTGVMAFNSFVNPYISESMAPGIGDSVNPMQVAMSLATLVWSVGMIGMFVYAFVSCMIIKNKADASLPVRENIYLSDYIDTPFVLGILRPRIYLPSTLAEDDKADFVIAHEKAHIRRHDHWWKPLGFLLLTIYWFNPVIWIAYILLCRDIELACDEYVIGNLKETEKKAYSEALLSCSMRSAGFHRNMISACPLAFGEVGVKDRVKAVLHYKRPAIWLLVVTAVSCIVVGVCFLTDPKDKALHAPEPFGHSYRVEEVVYDAPQFSLVYTIESAPQYSFSSDYVMSVSRDILEDKERVEWVQQIGKFEEVNLTLFNFDRYFTFFPEGEDGLSGILGPWKLRRNVKKAWRINVENNDNGIFYYFMLTKKGEVYLTYGYDFTRGDFEEKDGAVIRWVFKLTRTDILECNTVSEGRTGYIQPAYYPEGFDCDYEKLSSGYINEKGVLIFTADWDTDELVISEDYYHRYNTENFGGSTFIERETYTLEKNEAGQFELNVELRSENRDMAVYFIQGPVGVYVMKIIFAEDTASLDIAVKQGTSGQELLDQMVKDSEVSEQEMPDVDPEYVLNQTIKEAILNQYKPEKPDGLYHCADFVLLEQEELCEVAPMNSGRDNIELITVYGMALHESLGFSGATFHEVEYDYVPVKLKFQKESEHEYILKEAWFPEKPVESWDSYQEAIWDTFSPYSEELADDMIYAIWDDIYLTSLKQNCYEQAVSFGEVDTGTVIERLYTLWYCFGEFLEGGQTDLRGHIMASVCRDIALGWRDAQVIDSIYPKTTGQKWFDTFRSNAEELQKQYSEEETNELYHASWLLLQMIKLQDLSK